LISGNEIYLNRKTLRNIFYKNHHDLGTAKATDSLVYTEGVIRWLQGAERGQVSGGKGQRKRCKVWSIGGW